MHCNSYTSLDISHLLPTLLSGSDNSSFLLWALEHCKVVLWIRSDQCYSWVLCGFSFSHEPGPYWHLLCLHPLCYLPTPISDTWLKALSMCGSLVAVCCVYYIPSVFPFPTHQFRYNILLYSHSCCQPLFGYSTLTQLHHLWCEDKTDMTSSSRLYIKIEISTFFVYQTFWYSKQNWCVIARKTFLHLNLALLNHLLGDLILAPYWFYDLNYTYNI